MKKQLWSFTVLFILTALVKHQLFCQSDLPELDEINSGQINSQQNQNNETSEPQPNYDEYLRLQVEAEELKKSPFLNAELQRQQSESNLLHLIFENCPRQLKKIISLSKEDFDRYCPRTIILVGKPGVGKSTLALAIAQKFERSCRFICCSMLANEFKNSGCQNLLREIDQTLKNDPASVIILDEINVFTDKYQNAYDTDRDMAPALWQMMDSMKSYYPNAIIIATANNIDKLPDPLKDRFLHAIFELTPPSIDMRKKILRHHFNSRFALINNEALDYLASNTTHLSARILQSLVETTLLAAAYRTRNYYWHDNMPLISLKDAQEALGQIKNSMSICQYKPNDWTKDAKESFIKWSPYVMPVVGLLFSIYAFYKQSTQAAESVNLAQKGHDLALKNYQSFHDPKSLSS
jgi:SpoVK/Ycf46/Vps4 family AAA+-type ATPase